MNIYFAGAVAQRVPLAEVTNNYDSSATNYMEETATSSKMHETAAISTSGKTNFWEKHYK